MLLVVGVVSPFTPSPSSIEGVIYTLLPGWFHLVGLPEVVVQSGLLAFLTVYWVRHPENRCLGRVFGVGLVVMIAMSTLGVLAALGILPTASRTPALRRRVVRPASLGGS